MCTYCNGPHAFGTQWCLGQCWVPITTHAVQDHIAYLPNPSACADELWRVYGLTTKSLQGLVDDDPASSIHPIAFLMSGAIGTYRYYGDPKKKSVERLHLTPRLRRKLGRLHPTPRLRRKLGRGNLRYDGLQLVPQKRHLATALTGMQRYAEIVLISRMPKFTNITTAPRNGVLLTTSFTSATPTATNEMLGIVTTARTTFRRRQNTCITRMVITSGDKQLVIQRYTCSNLLVIHGYTCSNSLVMHGYTCSNLLVMRGYTCSNSLVL